MKINKIFLILCLVLFTSINANAIQNPNGKSLDKAKSLNATKKSAVSLDEQGNIIIEVDKLKNITTVSLIKHKIDQDQASLLEGDKIKITPVFLNDCNTLIIMWLLEQESDDMVFLPNSEETPKTADSSSEKK